MDAEQASQLLQRLKLIEQAATEQLNARRHAEHALVEARTKITQLDQALHSKVDDVAHQSDKWWILVFLGRPDKWDGGEKAMAQSELRVEGSRGSHNGHDECRKQYGRSEQRDDRKSEESQECAIILHPDHAMHWKSSGSHRKCAARLEHGGVVSSLSGVVSKTSCKTCCDDARSVGVSVSHERCGEQSGDDGTEDQRVREVREHRNSGIPEDWHRDSSDLIMNSHRLATFQDIKTEVTNVKHAQSAVMARSGDAMDVDAFTKGCKGISKSSGKEQDSEVVCWYCEKMGLSSFRMSHEAEGQRQWKVEGFQDKRQQKQEQQEKIQMHMLQVWQDWSHVERLQIQTNECIRSWRRVGRDGMHPNGMHRLERIGDRSTAVARRRSQNSKWDRIGYCSDCVPEECCGRLPDAPNAKQSEELQASVW